MELCALPAREGGEASQLWRDLSGVTAVEGLIVVLGSDMGVKQHKVPVPP